MSLHRAGQRGLGSVSGEEKTLDGGKGDSSALTRKGTGEGSLVTGHLAESLPHTAQQHVSHLTRGGLLLKEVAD